MLSLQIEAKIACAVNVLSFLCSPVPIVMATTEE